MRPSFESLTTNMNIVVTGATGFLGRHLVPILRENGHNVLCLNSSNCDLRSAQQLFSLAPGRVDQVYHLAAWTEAGDFCDKRRGEQWLVNSQINTNVLNWWHQQQPQAKLICLGTSVSYPKGIDLTENNYMAGEPLDRYDAYANSKRSLLVGLRSLQYQFGGDFLYVIPSTLYGPQYPMDGRQLHFIYDLIRKILAGNDRGEPVTLWGNGFQRRELVYVTDFASCLIRLSHVARNEVFNIGAAHEYTIREFASCICDIVGFDELKISYDSGEFVGAESKCLVTTKLDTFISNWRNTKLVDGLRKTIDWYRLLK